jgi:hypothetical protein
MEVHMTTSIIGLFENGDVASKVVGALTESGIKKDVIDILEGAAASEISGRLIDAGYEKEVAERYGRVLQKGGALVVAKAPDDEADDALETMRRFHTLTPDKLLEALEKPRPSGARANRVPTPEELDPEELDKAFQERTIEMVESTEKPVISKQARVIGEVLLSKKSGEREVVVTGTVRRQDVTVEDIGRKSVASNRF